MTMTTLPFVKNLFMTAMAALISAVLLNAGTMEAAPASTSGVNITFNGDEFTPEAKPFTKDGTIFLPLRDLGNLLNAVVYWSAKDKTVTLTYPERLVTLKLGSREADINGVKTALSAPIQMKNQRVYVPLRFFSEATGAKVEWKAASRTVAITANASYVKNLPENPAVWVNRKTGDLYTSASFFSKPAKAGTLNADFQEYLEVTAVKLDGDGLMVTVLDNYGEPHINFDVYTAFVKDNKLLKETKAHYWQRYEANVISSEGRPLLTDGKTLYLLNKDGKELASYDLPALVGLDEEYTVAAVDDSYLIVRPNRTGLLTLINLDNNQVVKLYQELLPTAEDLEYAEKNDVPYHGDTLIFAGETDDGTLKFLYDSPFDKKGELELYYTL
ncbi:copper amine oxidase N-terminal domain-containing protein [Paenibacillus jiagnxiensis]|uniref:copper amine oxidase N-terminal domain-containing protein n=1 Tax=Paenibacillus jiagnxiensis TaxID=3228926 RepID=UPI0033A70983